MAMQTDVVSGHIDASGFIVPVGRIRVKSIIYQPSGSGAGSVDLFDSTETPVAASYGRTGNVVTVTKTTHGLGNGARVGLEFQAASGNSATNGNYTITATTENTFTITDINSGNVSPGTACKYVDGTGGQWLASFSTLTSQTTPVSVLVPGQGMLVERGLYVNLTNASFVTVFYG